MLSNKLASVLGHPHRILLALRRGITNHVFQIRWKTNPLFHFMGGTFCICTDTSAGALTNVGRARQG